MDQTMWQLLLLTSLLGAHVAAHPLNAPNPGQASESTAGKFEDSIIEDPAGWNSFAYVHPNEYFGHQFEADFTKPYGTLISVGTFRGLNNAASGKVAHLIQMDFNHGVVLFNRANLQLIQLSKDRFEYLSLLLTGERHPDLEEKARRGKISYPAMAKALIEPYFAKVKENTLPDRWRALGMKFTDKEWEELKHVPANKLTLDYMMLHESKMSAALQNYERRGTLSSTLFGSNERFQTVQKMISEGRVSIVQGDLTGTKALTSIADALRQHGREVAAIDISNVPDYFDPPKGKVQWEGMLRNLRQLPYAKNGRVLFTHNDNGASPHNNTSHHDGFAYHSLPVSRLGDWNSDFLATYDKAATPPKLVWERSSPLDPKHRPSFLQKPVGEVSSK